MTLREDSDPYCMLWVGVILLSSYYFNFLYLMLSVDGYVNAMAGFMLPLAALPILLVFTLIGYLKPERSRMKPTMLAISTVLALFVLIFSILAPAEFGGGVFLASWAIGSALLTAGGLSIMQPLDESISPGLLDVSSLHYGPPSDDATADAVAE